ncbi:HpcH/HpaI aldolase/citrate lyase family protein [Halolamina sp.]|jgi:2-dehydro-3-deoxyglucarate aldolase/4-hydroxy-2-oxoheptanedioate aldolase|uniref:HpcH/HpaI aldolase family protein n=1 Tax=Halolamina sp. TaxID=1940283 RepID=UPI000223B813|nr:2-dehydro-3-deoxyglucarate aldolase [halophilic archaeon DL31]
MSRRQRTDRMDLRQQLAADASPIGSWVSLGSPAAAEIVGALEFDFVVVDTEHTPLSIESVEDLVRAVDASGQTDTVVRVPENDETEIKRALDLGAAGVMAPQVETEAEAEELVAATRYPPEGIRGIAGSRANGYGKDIGPYFEAANDEVAVLPQVETATGLTNVAEVAAVDGVDALFVGPADLSADLGCFGEYDAPEFVNAVDRVLDAGDHAGIPVGTLATSPDQISMWDEWGMDFLIAGTDIGYLREGAAAAKECYESLQSEE